MDSITVEHNPAPAKLEVLGIYDWPQWSKEISTFDWTYETDETCYLLAGEVLVTPENSPPVLLRRGDLVVFPAGLSCTWEIRQAVRKHYRFG